MYWRALLDLVLMRSLGRDTFNGMSANVQMHLYPTNVRIMVIILVYLDLKWGFVQSVRTAEPFQTA